MGGRFIPRMVYANGNQMSGSEEMLAWYAVSIFSGYEKQVKQFLEERIVQNNMQDRITQIIVPKEEVVEMKAGQKRKTERKFFPGYVLIEMELDDETWHLIKNAPRVMGFVGTSTTTNKPRPISEKEISAIHQRMSDGAEKPRPKILFEAGEIVRVIEGPFNDFSGMIEEVNYEKSRLLVLVQIFGRSTPVELSFSQVEKS